MRVTAGYDVHGLHLVADAPDGAAIDALDRRLAAFRSTVRPAADVRLHLGADPFGPPPGPSRPVYDAPDAQVGYFAGTDELYVEHHGVALRCAPEAGLIRLAWRHGDAADVWTAVHPLFTIALLEVLKRHGRYSLHAACAAISGRGVLLAGPSGAGKSTLSIALARAGWAFVSDDMVFLAATASGLEILGFPDEVDVTESTLGMFPELAPHARAPQVPGRGKASLRLEDALGFPPLLSCQPAALVLPSVADRPHSALCRVGSAEALVELAPNILLTEVTSAQGHLAALGTLVDHTPCYRLATGRDFDEIPRLLAGIVADAG